MILGLPVELLSRVADSQQHSRRLQGISFAAQDKQSAIAAVAQKSLNLGLVTLNNFEYHSHGHSIVYFIK